MSVSDPDLIRNVCVCGHSGAGKTTLVERLLFEAGEIKRLGSVEDGNTVSDFTEEERQFHHSLHPTIVRFHYDQHQVNLIDTPGMSDFIGHAIACLPATETALIVIDAAKGIDSEAKRFMQISEQLNLARMLLVNKMDAADVDLAALTAQIQDAFGETCLPINLPTPSRDDVVDIFETQSHDATAFGTAEQAHQRIVEQVVEVDEELMAEYLEAGEQGLQPDRVHAAFEQALRDRHLVPIVYASAKTGAGIRHLLHVAASLLPNPVEANPRPIQQGGQLLLTTFDASRPTIAHIFQVLNDKHLGKLGIFRVHQGTVRSKSELYLDDQRKPLRIGHVMHLHGKEYQDAEEIGPGEMGAIAKIDELHYDGILHDGATPDNPPHMLPLALPQPMYGLAIELKNHADETKFSTVIRRLQAEDPCLLLERVAATKQTVLRGLGELHLRVILEKLSTQYGIKLETSPPKIAYKETITNPAEGHHRHKKQTGGAGQFGEVYLRVKPLPPSDANGFEFENQTVGGSIPKQFMPSIEKGIRQVLQDGAVAGYPMTGIRVEVYDGKYHDVDSKEIAFVTAGKKAFIDAVKKASPVLLEPYVAVKVSIPAAALGDVTSDLALRRGRINDTQILDGSCLVGATAPLGELQNYATHLKSMLAGDSGSFVLEYSHDEPAPADVQRQLMAAYQPHEDDS